MSDNIFGEYQKKEKIVMEDPKYQRLEAEYKMRDLETNLKLNETQQNKIIDDRAMVPLPFIFAYTFATFGAIELLTKTYDLFAHGPGYVGAEYMNNKWSIFYDIVAFPAGSYLAKRLHQESRAEKNTLKTLELNHAAMVKEYQTLETILKENP